MTGTEREIAPVHPGEILLEEFLKPVGMTIHELALALRVPANRISQIVEGGRGVSPDTALRLGRYFGTGPEFWINLQSRFAWRAPKTKSVWLSSAKYRRAPSREPAAQLIEGWGKFGNKVPVKA
jgi:addiction module HigA family antidote